MKPRPSAPLLLLVLALGLPVTARPASPASKETLKAEVAAMEDAFCTLAREKGILAAFEHDAAPDVAFVDTDPRRYRGLAAVRERLGPDRLLPHDLETPARRHLAVRQGQRRTRPLGFRAAQKPKATASPRPSAPGRPDNRRAPA